MTTTTKPNDDDPQSMPHANKPNDKVKDAPTDADIANPVDGNDYRQSPDVDAQESPAARQARFARENEAAVGQGKPEPHKHD